MPEETNAPAVRPEPSPSQTLKVIDEAEKVIEQVDPKLLKDLPPNQRHRVIEVVQSVTTQFQGPMPPPSMMAQYEDIMPGLAKGIFDMAVREQEHRHHCEKQIVSTQKSVMTRGQHYALVFGLAGFIAATICAWHGSNAVAGIIGGTVILGGVTVFALGRERSSGGEARPPAEPQPTQTKQAKKKNVRTGG